MERSIKLSGRLVTRANITSPEFWALQPRSLRFRVFCITCARGKDFIACASDAAMFLQQHEGHKTIFTVSKVA